MIMIIIIIVVRALLNYFSADVTSKSDCTNANLVLITTTKSASAEVDATYARHAAARVEAATASGTSMVWSVVGTLMTTATMDAGMRLLVASPEAVQVDGRRRIDIERILPLDRAVRRHANYCHCDKTTITLLVRVKKCTTYTLCLKKNEDDKPTYHVFTEFLN